MEIAYLWKYLLELCGVTHVQDQSNHEITLDIQNVKLLPNFFFLCLFSYQDINGEVQDLRKLAGEAEYVKSGCGAACENNACKNHGKCLDNYNVYLCDCSKTPYYGYFCEKGKLCW